MQVDFEQASKHFNKGNTVNITTNTDKTGIDWDNRDGDTLEFITSLWYARDENLTYNIQALNGLPTP